MQLDLPWNATEWPVLFVRHRRARRYLIRVLADGTVRVTLPLWGARRDAMAFVERSRAWIVSQQAKRAQERTVSRAWRHGTLVWFDGVRHALCVTTADEGLSIQLGAHVVPSTAHEDPGDVRGVVERWLRARAEAELEPRLRMLAAAHQIDVTRVSIRNQRTRWGACSATGTLTLNWRLVQVPPAVRDYVLIHELMHRRELNHSRRFWRHVAAACPDYRDARRWLLAHGRELL
jgi:predicted metal-dependent hydrolase